MLTGTAFQDEIGPGLGYTPSKGPVTAGIEETEFYHKTGPTISRLVYLSPPRAITFGAVVSNDFGISHIYGQKISIPAIVEGGFIVEDTDFDMELWNTHKKQVTVNSITYDPSSLGLSLSVTTPPFDLVPFGSEQMVLTILQEGDPQQDTDIVFNVTKPYGLTAGDETFRVIATRVITMPFEPNWTSGIQYGYNFETVLAQVSERFTEQRRWLRNYPRRTARFKVEERNTTAQKLFQRIQFGKDKLFGIPLYNEIFRPSNATAGDTVINTTEDISSLWNLNNNCSFVMFYDIEQEIAELRELTSVGATSITLLEGLRSSFTVANTFMYPVFLASLDSVTFDGLTDDFNSADLSFEEYS